MTDRKTRTKHTYVANSKGKFLANFNATIEALERLGIAFEAMKHQGHTYARVKTETHIYTFLGFTEGMENMIRGHRTHHLFIDKEIEDKYVSDILYPMLNVPFENMDWKERTHWI